MAGQLHVLAGEHLLYGGKGGVQITQRTAVDEDTQQRARDDVLEADGVRAAEAAEVEEACLAAAVGVKVGAVHRGEVRHRGGVDHRCRPTVPLCPLPSPAV